MIDDALPPDAAIFFLLRGQRRDEHALNVPDAVPARAASKIFFTSRTVGQHFFEIITHAAPASEIFRARVCLRVYSRRVGTKAVVGCFEGCSDAAAAPAIHGAGPETIAVERRVVCAGTDPAPAAVVHGADAETIAVRGVVVKRANDTGAF